MADVVVEDGTGIEDANSYVSSDDFETYAENYFSTTDQATLTAADGDAVDSALIRASAALDGAYRLQYPGYRTAGREQGLEWPRTAAYDYENIIIDSDEVPKEIIQATCETAIRELTTPNSMQPDLERGGFIRRLQAGSVSIEYTGGGQSGQNVYTRIENILSGLIGSTTGYAYMGKAVRG